MNATVYPITGSTHLLDIGEQNVHMLDQLDSAYMCAAKLVRAGFTVLSVHVEHHRPVVWIQNGSLCGEIEGAVMIRRPGPLGVCPHCGKGHFENVMAAPLEGCQVQWIVRGH